MNPEPSAPREPSGLAPEPPEPRGQSAAAGRGGAAAPQGWGVDAWRAVSCGAALALGAVSLYPMLRTRGAAPWMALAACLALAVSLGAALGLRLAILDFLGGFHYREKFALFLGHLVLLISPLALFGGAWLGPGLALVLIALAAQTVNPLGFHRYLALCALMILMALWRRPPGEVAWALAWMALAGALLVARRVRFALEESGAEDLRVSPWPALAMWGIFAGAPVALAAAAAALWTPPAPAARLRPLAGWESGAARPPAPSLDPGRLVWQALGVAVALAVAIGVLHWLASRRARKAKAAPTAEELLARAEADTAPPPPPPREPAPLAGGSPRARILRAWRRWERALAALELKRRAAWTSREYTARLSRIWQDPAAGETAPGAQAPPAVRSLADLVRLFERARYHRAEPEAQDAAAFEEVAEFTLRETQILAEAERRETRRVRRATPPDRGSGGNLGGESS